MDLEATLKDVDSELAGIIRLVAEKSQEIRSSFSEHKGISDTTNVYGDEQMALDLRSHEILAAAFKESNNVKEFSSEESPEITKVNPNAKYAVAFDPLDGSSCIKTNLATGTIVGIFKNTVLDKGENLAAAMYVLYGPRTTLVLAIDTVNEYEWQKDHFELIHKDMKMTENKKIMGLGAKKNDYTPQHAKFVETLNEQGYKIRFSGAFVADFNQILHYGGIFTYPGTQSKPGGTLRLLFEAIPIAFICERAGGGSSDGKQSLLKVQPEKFDQRVPIYIGSKEIIEMREAIK